MLTFYHNINTLSFPSLTVAKPKRSGLRIDKPMKYVLADTKTIMIFHVLMCLNKLKQKAEIMRFPGGLFDN